MKKRVLMIRIAFFFGGIILLAFGICTSVYSGLGTAPMATLLVGLQKSLGLTVGSWEFIVGAILVVMNAFFRKKKPDLLAFLTAFITGVFIDVWMFILGLLPIVDLLFVKLLYLLLGIVFIGLGIAMYLQAKFSPSPLDETMMVIHEVFGFKLSNARTIMSVLLVGVGFLFGGPAGVGTIVMVFGIGPVIGRLYPLLGELKGKLMDNRVVKENEISKSV